MLITLKICDICAGSGEVALGAALYEGDGRALWVACEDCLEMVRLSGLSVVKEFEYPGDADPDRLYQ